MNHRELMRSRAKKSRHAFLNLPENLQDKVINGLDRGELTLEGAEDLIKSEGHSLSHQAVSNYYEAVRIERRLAGINDTVASAIDQFKEQPIQENLKTLINMLMGAAMAGIGNGTVGIKDIDVATLLKNMPAEPVKPAAEDRERQKEGSVSPQEGEAQPSTIEKVRALYGLA